MIKYARFWVSSGWAITPLHWMTDGVCSCGNPRRDPNHDKAHGGKHPILTRWQLNPISTLPGAEEAWARYPRANIGGLTGAPSGVWALDMDPDNGASESDIPEAKTASRIHQTGSGGKHFIYRISDSFCPSNSRGQLPAGWDVRGTGGQIVLPPSVTGKGSYSIVKNFHPGPTPGAIEAAIRGRKRNPTRTIPI